MYDCQQDSYTDFCVSDFEAMGRAHPLSGSLSATPLTPSGQTSLHELTRFASERGYESRREGDTLTVSAITLSDALAANARFGAALLISCDLRCESPVRI